MRRIVVPLFVGMVSVIASGCAHTQAPAAAPAATTPPPATKPAAEAPAKPAKPAPAVDISPGVTRVRGTATGFTLTEKIQFADGKADILPASESLVQEIATVLKDNPDLQQVFIAGYTSSEGGQELNQKLSEGRAAAVRTWLVSHGIEGSRLVTGGFGPADPIADNATEEGREKNRRVEFTALKYEVNGQIHENPPPTVHAAK